MARRILILDDSVKRQIVLRTKLGAACYEIKPAATLREAQRHVARSRPHLVIVAAEAGGGQGARWAQRLRAHPSAADLPMMMLVPDAGMRLEALRAGADEVIVTPIDDALMLARSSRPTASSCANGSRRHGAPTPQ